MSRIIITIFMVLLLSCEGNILTTIELPFSVENNPNIFEDPLERWNSHHIRNYKISQGWVCECLPPAACTAIIRNNILADVNFEISPAFYYGRTIEEINQQTKNMALSVEEAFALIDQYKSTAHKVDVKYHKKYGYPEEIHIDIDPVTADEEIIRYFYDLEKIQ